MKVLRVRFDFHLFLKWMGIAMDYLKFGILQVAAVVILGVAGNAWSAEVPKGYDPKLVEAGRAEGELVIYSAMRRSLGVQLIDQYEKLFGIKVHFTRKSTGAIVQMIEAERLAGAARFDVTGTADESVIRRWLKQGLLEPYNPANARHFPKKLAKPVGYLNYVWASMYVIAYNKKKVSADQAPRTWKDATDPKWKKRIAIADPKTAAGARLFLDIAYEKYGWEYFRALSKNQPLLVKSIAALPRLLLAGEADVTLVAAESDHVLRISKGEPFGLVYPTDFIPAAKFAVAIRKNAPHPNAARLWLEFELSPEAQRIYANSGRMALRPGTEMPFK